MNTAILNKEIQDFIQENLKSDLTKLILKGSPFKNVAIQEIAEQIQSKNKCEQKLPTWFNSQNIYFPPKLNIEQTSSEITANYKAGLVSGKSLVDISGGFGVDSFYFSKKVERVFHCEINQNLSKIANHNFKQLKATNCEIHNVNGIELLLNSNSNYDWIYADPSRRNKSQGKVFLLKDCEPNIPINLELLFSKTENLLIKASPLLDISSAIKELKFVKEVHIVAVNNEVKEVLYKLKKFYTNPIQIITANFETKKIQKFNFEYNKKATANYSLPQTYLYEPNSAILKSGGFNVVSEQFKLNKLHSNTHLYTSENLIDFPGRTFKVEEVVPYNIKQLKKQLLIKKANITIRNFRETVTHLRKKTKILDGGSSYLFFTTNINNEPIILVCKKL